jgi:hypothetical protein
MKSKIAVIVLGIVIFLFPGCYTVLLLDDSTETPATVSTPVSQPTVEYIPVYYSIPVPEPTPQPPRYLSPTPYIPDNPSSSSPSIDSRREIQTGRGSANSNQEPARNNENTTRDSGVQRGGR